MKKSLTRTSKAKREKKLKSFSFFTRITSLTIIAAAVIVSAVFSIFYLDNNHNLSIEFAGGYQTQVEYQGVHQENNNTQGVIDLLEKRIDSAGTSNINIEKSSSTGGDFYNVSISKDAGIDMATFINNLSRRGYLYLLDENGHDLLANEYNKESKTWSAREKRLITSDAFSSITDTTNPNSHQPEVVFKASPESELIAQIEAIIEDNDNTVYFYSDIGNLLNYIRNTLSGLQDLVDVIIGETDPIKQNALKVLLANHTLGLSDDNGNNMFNAIMYPTSDSGKELINIMNQSKNGMYMIDWVYSETSLIPLLVDTNNDENIFDPNNPFDPAEPGKSSPMNAWLPHIKDLIILPDISKFLETSIISYKYAPYYIGEINKSASFQSGEIKINDNTFNKGKVEQIVNLLVDGEVENNFLVEAFLTIDPTLGAQALKASVIALGVALGFLSLLIFANYRLLGLIAIFIIILFLIVTLVSFTFLNNVIAPETGLALIIGLALLLDLILGLFNSLKKEYQSGKSVYEAFKTANKKSIVSAFDCSLIVLIVSLTIFWFGSRSIRGFAIMTTISTFGVIVLGVLVLRLVLYLLLKNNVFENKASLLALTQRRARKSKKQKTKRIKNVKYNQAKTKLNVLVAQTKGKANSLDPGKWNYHKSTRWIMVAFAVILLTGGIVFLAAGANFSQGFDSRNDFTGETFAETPPTDPDFNLVAEANSKRDIVVNILQENNKSYQKVYWALKFNSLTPSTNSVIRIIIETNINNDDASDLLTFLRNDPDLRWGTWNSATNNALSGNELFKNMLIAIAIALVTIFIYIIIRFQFSFTIPLIVALVFAVFVTLATLVAFHITISTMTIGVILAIVILVLINSVIIFDNIKDIKLTLAKTKNEKLEKDEIIAISNEGVKRSLPRTIVANGIIMVTALIVVCFLPSFWAVSLALIIGSIITFLVSHFLTPWLWTYFERWRIRRAQKRAKKIKKHFVGPDEYVIAGIND